MTDSSLSQRPTNAELLALLDAPDLTPRERREIKKTARHQQRIEKWELRRATPHPPKIHRAIITLLMMAATLAVLWLLLFGR